MSDNFFKRLARDVYYGDTGRDTDHPKCPQCGKRMTFHGGDLPLGDGYWECSRCGFSFSEDELEEHLDI